MSEHQTHGETHGAGEESGHEGHEEHSGPNVVLFIFIGLLLGAILREVNKKTKIPYTPMLLVLGMVLGYIRDHLGVIGESTSIIEQLNPHMILMIFIPVLIFESAFNCEWHVFRKSLLNIVLLAGPGVLWGAILIAVTFKTILAYPDQEMTWYMALTLGCVLSATDPVAVVALLKELGASARFNTLVEGESLLNDGTAMVFFMLFLNLAKGQTATFVQVVGNFIRIAFGGPILGVVTGFIVSFWMKRIIRDYVLTITITFVGAFLCFYIAEFTWVKVSGILSIVSYGLYMSAVSKRKIYPESEHALHNVWASIQYACETLIFLLTGIVVGVEMIEQSTIRGTDWLRMFLFWFLMIFLRALMVLTLYPILRSNGYGLNKKELIVLIYGGLRGALGLCLSLIVGVDTVLPERFRELTVFYMCGMAFLTIVVNGLTCGKLVAYLGMIEYPMIKEKLLRRCVRGVLSSTQHKLKELKVEPDCAYANWQAVERMAKVHRMGETIHKIAHQIPHDDVRDSIVEVSHDKILIEIRFKFTRSLHKLYWEMYEDGELGEESIKILSDSCDIMNDDVRNKLHYWNIISANFTPETLKYYIYFKDYPLIGSFMQKILVQKIYFMYEISTAFTEACEEATSSFHRNFPIGKSSHAFGNAMKEVADNIESATFFISEIEGNYNSIIKAVHTSRAATILLKHKKHELKNMYEEGYVDEGDYDTLRKEIDHSIVDVYLHSFRLDPEAIGDINVEVPILSTMNRNDTVELKLKSEEVDLAAGKVLLREGTYINHVYIITRGTIKEIFADFSFTRGFGSIVNPYDYTYHQPSKCSAKAVNHVKLLKVPKDLMEAYMKKYPELKKQWYKGIFHYSIRHDDHLDYLEQQMTEKKLRRYLEATEVYFLKEGESITLEFGGYLFEGNTTCGDSTYEKGHFLSKTKLTKALSDAVLMKFINILELEFSDERISVINEG